MTLLDEEKYNKEWLIWNPGEKYADSHRKFQGIASIERASNGRLWATWYGGGEDEGPENYIMLATSGDDGYTWSPLKLVIDPKSSDGTSPIRASEPCLWHDPLGRLWLLWGHYPNGLMAEGSSNWCMLTEQSELENAIWSEPRKISGEVTFNKPIVLSTGRWLFPSGCWVREGTASRANLTDDQGKHFVRSGEIIVPEGREFDEYMVVEKSDHSLWMLNRTDYGIAESTSFDGGETWSILESSSIAHTTSRFYLRRLHSGRLLLVKHGQIHERIDRSDLRAYLSEDDGKTWIGGMVIDEREGVAYPDAIEASNGLLYVIYDYKRKDEKEILLSTFTENDVLAGYGKSEEARFRLVVNKAGGSNPSN